MHQKNNEITETAPNNMPPNNMPPNNRGKSRERTLRACLVGAAGLAAMGAVVGGVMRLTSPDLQQQPTSQQAQQEPGLDRQRRGEPGEGGATAGEINAALVDAGRLLDESKASQAEAVLRNVLAKTQEDPELYAMYGEVMLTMGRNTEAYKSYKSAVALRHDDPELQYSAGIVANAVGETQRAIEHIRTALAMRPDEARFALNLAHILRKNGEDQKAMANFLRAVTLDPTIPNAWGVMADMELAENNTSLARTHIRKARDLEPNELLWRIVEARIERRENNPDAALRLLLPMDRALLHASHAGLDTAAACMAMRGEPERARELYEAARKNAPSDPVIMRELALWNERLGDTEDALGLAKAAAILGDAIAGDIVSRLEHSQDAQ